MFLKSIIRSLKVNEFTWGLAEKLIRTISAPVSIFFVAIYMDSISQGFFYTFISLMSVKFLLELGFTQIIITFVAYEKNKLRLKKKFLIGTYQNYLRFKSISKYFTKWFFYSSFIYFILVFLIGYYLFLGSNELISFWLYPFLILAFFSAVEIAIIPLYAINEGLGKLKEVYMFRFFKALLFIILFILLLINGYNLWSFPLCLGVNVIIDIIFLVLNKNLLFQYFRLKNAYRKVFDVKKELITLQFKTAVGAIAGFLTFSLITPYTFSLLGPEIAGKVGLTLALVTGISSFSVVPATISIQRMASLVNKKDIKGIEKLLIKLLAFMISIHLIAILFLYITYNLLNQEFPYIIDKFLEPKLLIIYFIASMISIGTMPITIFMRAHKEEPIMWLSLFTGIIIASGSYFGINFYGVFGSAIVYLVTVSMVLPILIKIFIDFRNRYF